MKILFYFTIVIVEREKRKWRPIKSFIGSFKKMLVFLWESDDEGGVRLVTFRRAKL